MQWWKRAALASYYYGDYPRRARCNAQRRRSGQAPVMLLFYHRIADTLPNDWTARTAVFTRQIRWLKKHFDVVSLAEAQRRVRSAANHRPAISVTFDDGYVDNCGFAIPLLIAEEVPCTYFVATHHVLHGEPFAHDVKRGQPLAPNTPAQIRDMAAAGIEIGCHTRTHANLGSISDPARLRDEIVTSRGELEQMTGKPVRYFAFPFGHPANMSSQAFSLLHREGYEAVCSAYGGFNFPGDDAFHLQRIHVDDDLIRLKNWVTLDPRKVQSTDRYEYDLEPAEAALEPVGASS